MQVIDNNKNDKHNTNNDKIVLWKFTKKFFLTKFTFYISEI